MPADAKSIFLAAADKPAADRAAHLDAACAGDAALRQRVEALLRAHDEPGDSPGTGDYAPSAVPAFATGSVFAGRYKLREVLGEGGMGTVYVADQSEPVQRRVALKVIRTGLDSARLLARFEQERQALALMDHPNIAKVFDAGVSGGVPYFAMELIKGVPITRYCDEARLTPRQRLELFIPVCQAVQHAHQKGIIHRDLKPSNVLIGLYDGTPVPKVIDFGVAKATGPRLTEQSVYTEVGSLVGTLEYMAPEQAELNNLDIDTRADVYTLGVILYELLTGSVPFSRKDLQAVGFAEMLRTIKEVEPPKPSTRLSGSGQLPAVAASRSLEPRRLVQQLRGELDWIAMKCLEKERSRRYETANQLALEVQRYLTDEPVAAGPPSAAYRLRTFVRRNRGPVVAASVVVLALAGGIIGTTWSLIEASRQRDAKEAERTAAVTAREEAARERDRAVAARKRTREALDAMVSGVTRDSLVTQKEISDEQKAFLRSVLEYYEEFAAEAGDDRDTRDRLAYAHLELGKMRYELGQRDECLTVFQRAAELYERLAADFPGTYKYRAGAAISHVNRGRCLEDLGRKADAEAALRTALAAQEALIAEYPRTTGPRYGVIHTYASLAKLQQDQGKQPQAEAMYRTAIATSEALVAEHPKDAQFLVEVAAGRQSLGELLHQQGQLAKAEVEYRAARAAYQALAADHPGEPRYRGGLATCHSKLGGLFLDRGETAEAEAEFLSSVAVADKLAADFPVLHAYRQKLANAYSSLGYFYHRVRKPAAAEEAFRTAISIVEQLLATFPDVVDYRDSFANLHNNLGYFYATSRRFAQAAEAYQTAIPIYEKLVREYPNVPVYRRMLAAAYGNLGTLKKESGKPSDAEAAYRAALVEQKTLVAKFPTVPAYRQDLGKSHNNIAVVLEQLGKLQDGEAMHRAAVAVREPLAAEFPVVFEYREELTASRAMVACACARQGRPTEGAALADATARHPDAGWQTLFNCACALGLAAGATDNPNADAHGARTVAVLRLAIVRGFRAIPHMLVDPDLASIRSRADYAELLWDLADGMPRSK